MQFNFEWDPDKAGQNLRKHRVTFERAAEVFLDPFMMSIPDDEHSDDEDRWVTIGCDHKNVPPVVVHTFRTFGPEACAIRLIPARKATLAERKQYLQR